MHIPGVSRPWWERVLRKKWPIELVVSIPPLVAAAIGAYRLFDDATTKTFGIWSAGIAVWILVATIAKIAHVRELDKDAEAKRDHDGLRAACLVLQATAAHACGVEPANMKQLRVTFHGVEKPIKDPQRIEQLVPYAGGEGGGEGRKFSVRTGLTGRCIRVKQPYTMHRADGGDVVAYQKTLAADWGYTQGDVSKVSTDKMSYMAVPILESSGSHAVGVVYLDGVPPNLFDAPDAQAAILAACGGVTQYVNERYAK